MKIKIGTEFYAAYADGVSRWKVIGKKGPETWAAEIQPDPIVINGKTYEGDWVGVQKAFFEKEIIQALEWEKFDEEQKKKHEGFIKSLKEGQTVHYHHGFGGFVRCRVVQKDGENTLLPVAIVGEWSSFDLPQRDIRGNINWGYHATNIQNGKTFTPHASNIYESPDYAGHSKNKTNPALMTPIDLTLPELNNEEKSKAKFWKKVEEIQVIIKDQDAGPEAILERIRASIDF